MPRARNLKVSFFKNEELAECDVFARLLFQALWCEADRDGRLEDRPKRLKVEYLPYDDVDIDALLWQLADRGFIRRYSVNGRNYIWIPNFCKHQRPHKKEESRCYPEYSGQDRENSGLAVESSLPAALNAECGMLNADGAECGILNPELLPSEVCTETSEADVSPPPAVMEFPTEGKAGKKYFLTVEKFEEYRNSYPHLDVIAEFRAALQWCRDHPAKRKTVGGMPAFLTSWLNRSQNRSRAGPSFDVPSQRPQLDPAIWRNGSDG